MRREGFLLIIEGRNRVMATINTNQEETMRLQFIEHGEVLDTVELVDGELRGREASIRMIRNRMQRRGQTVEEAIKDMHGWSNGYLNTRLEGR